MNNSILIGAAAGLIFGLLVMLLLGGGAGSLITPTIMGALIGFVGTKVQSYGILGVGAATGAAFFAITALLSNMLILDHTITGAVIGLMIGLIIKLVMPKLIAKTK